MRPTSRAATTGRPARPHGAVRPARPRWVPRLATPPGETPGAPDAPESAVDRERPRRLRPKAWLVVAVVVLLVEALVVVWVIASADQETEVALSEPLVAPSDLPPRGSLVISHVRSDGRVEVTQWIRGLEPLDAVTVTTPTVAGAGQVEVSEARLVADDGTVLAEAIRSGAAPQRIPVDGPTRLVRATYVLDGVSAASTDAPGRLLVQPVSLAMVSAEGAGPVVVEVEGADAGAVVRNLACTDARSPVTVQRPCGSPAGSAWRVRLGGQRREDVVTAQVDVPQLVERQPTAGAT